MQFRHRVTVIGFVVFIHLFLLLNIYRTEHIPVAHEQMTVSFDLSEFAKSTPSNKKIERTTAAQQSSPEIENKNEAEATDPIIPNEAVSDTQSVTAAAQSAVSTLPSTEPDYLAAYLSNRPPSYPAVARRMGWQGKVLVSVEVLADGSAGQVKLQSSSGHPVLDEVALKAVRDWHFSPARHAGQPVDKWFLVPIPFILKESE